MSTPIKARATQTVPAIISRVRTVLEDWFLAANLSDNIHHLYLNY